MAAGALSGLPGDAAICRVAA
ncbi:hypothetical protein SM89_04770, partial [Klebsiella quasipneumoniae]